MTLKYSFRDPITGYEEQIEISAANNIEELMLAERLMRWSKMMNTPTKSSDVVGPYETKSNFPEASHG